MWQWQLDGTINQSKDVDVYDIDLFEAEEDGSIIESLQSKGIKVICYFSAGTYEYYRYDWSEYFSFIKEDESYSGNKPPFAGKMSDWDERWLDIRKIKLLTPIMTSRIQKAVDLGCDAIEPDNMDVYEPDNVAQAKKPIRARHQLRYNKFIANTAHELGISVGLKNDLGQLEQLVEYYDFAVNEQCFEFNECDEYKTFTNKDTNKAVFGAEYKGNPSVFCPKANEMNLSFQKKRKKLDAWRIGCEDYDNQIQLR